MKNQKTQNRPPSGSQKPVPLARRAPPVFRPGSKPVQAKMQAPAVYRPASSTAGTHSTVQRSTPQSGTATKPLTGNPRAGAPPVYRPPAAVQPKMPAMHLAGRQPGPPPPVYKPFAQQNAPTQAVNLLQRKMSAQPLLAKGPQPPVLKPAVRVAGGMQQIGNLSTRTIQRASMSPAEKIKQRAAAFETKRKKMYAFIEELKEGDENLYSDQSELDELADKLFKGISSQETAAVAKLNDGRILVAHQSGKAAAAVKGTDYIAADGIIPVANMHAEMILLYYAYRNGLEGEISAIGVAGGKGCCRLCSAMLLSEGIAFTKTGPSKYEIQWQDPMDAMNKLNQATWSSMFGEGSGVSAMERALI